MKNAQLAALMAASVNFASGIAVFYFTIVSVQPDALWSMHPWFWAVFACLTQLCCVLFLRKPRTVPQMVAAGGMLAAAYSVVLNLTTGTTLFWHCTLCLMAAYLLFTQMKALLTPPSVLRQLARIDISVIALVWFGMVSIAYPNPELLSLQLFNFFLNLSAAAILRMLGRQDDVMYGNPREGILLCIGILVLLCGGSLLIILLLGGAGKDLTGSVVSAAQSGLFGLGHLISRFVEWLVSILPSPDPDDYALLPEPEEVSVSGNDMLPDSPVNVWIMIALAIAAIAGLVVLICILLWLLRKVRFRHNTEFHAMKGISSGRKVRRSAPGPAAKLLRLLTAIRYRNTPEGVLFFCELMAKRRGCPRSPGQNTRDFFLQLCKTAGCDDTDFLELNRVLDARLFGGRAETFSPSLCRDLRHCMFRRLPRASRRKAHKTVK